MKIIIWVPHVSQCIFLEGSGFSTILSPTYTVAVFFYDVSIMMWLLCIYFYWLILETEEGGEQEIAICYSIYLWIYRLILVCVMTSDQTYNLVVAGWCSNQMSYPARARMPFNLIQISKCFVLCSLRIYFPISLGDFRVFRFLTEKGYLPM